jgi:hypothetical protein
MRSPSTLLLDGSSGCRSACPQLERVSLGAKPSGSQLHFEFVPGLQEQAGIVATIALA